MESTEDASVNFIKKSGNGLIEARFVQRTPDYFIVYLSSQNGCRQSCRFCHLTATRQTTEKDVDLDGYLYQARSVLTHANKIAGKATKIHYNFMARGEPLANQIFIQKSNEIFKNLGDLRPDLENKFLVSSIIPKSFVGSLANILSDERSTLYYSLYSMKTSFRKRWLPKAMDPEKALDIIAEYQAITGKKIALHWAFIDGQNDHVEDVETILEAVKTRGIQAKFNLLRYNPYNSLYGQESDEETIKKLFTLINEAMPHPRNRIVPRVGYDVKASCGMFVETNSIIED